MVMDFTTVGFLAQDGLTLGAIYGMLALGMVLVYSVTRVIFVPLGEFVTFGGLTLASLQSGMAPKLVYFSVVLGLAAFIFEVVEIRQAQSRWSASALLATVSRYLMLPLTALLLSFAADWSTMPAALQIVMTFAVILPLGGSLYRLVFQPLRDASTLVLLIAAVGLHLALLGLALIIFGPEGARAAEFSAERLSVGGIIVPWQAICICIALVVLCAGLYLYFEHSISGKALRATSFNRLGARLVGIDTAKAGRLALTLGVAVGGLCGILIAPIATLYYDSGFVIGLKGFIGAILAGMASFPLALVGAFGVGMVEAYASFVASAFKESIVFALVIPILLVRSIASRSMKGDH